MLAYIGWPLGRMQNAPCWTRNPPARPPFPADPRADQRPRSRAAARSRCRRSIIAAPSSQPSRARCSSQIRTIFKTEQPVIIYPSSGTGAWEAALVNTLSPGDPVIMVETGHFATLWRDMAERLGVQPEFIPGDWRHGADPAAIEARLAEDRGHAIKAVCVVHNETSTGVTSRIARGAPGDRPGRPPCPAHGRYHLLARLDRLPARRVGRRRHGRRLAKRPDAAARSGPSTRSARRRWPPARTPACPARSGTGSRCSPPTPRDSSPTRPPAT